MRNIRGGLGKFQEVYPDEGEMDFFQAMRILRDVQFARPVAPLATDRRLPDQQRLAVAVDRSGDVFDPIDVAVQALGDDRPPTAGAHVEPRRQVPPRVRRGV